MMIWIIVEDDGAMTVTAEKEKAVEYVTYNVENKVHFKVIPFDEKSKGALYCNI